MGKRVFVAATALALVLVVAPLLTGAAYPAEHNVKLKATSFAFEPGVIRVRRGDRVSLELESLDVTHGIYIDAYEVEAIAEPGRKATIQFVADRAGKFRYRCSVACGTLHPFMIGELVVEPNSMFPRTLILMLAVFLSWAVSAWGQSRTKSQAAQATDGWRFDLTRARFLRDCSAGEGYSLLSCCPFSSASSWSS